MIKKFEEFVEESYGNRNILKTIFLMLLIDNHINTVMLN